MKLGGEEGELERRDEMKAEMVSKARVISSD